MKVLLVGEYSGFHGALKKGLMTHGIECTLLGSGDGFKNMPVDINYLPKPNKNRFAYLINKQFHIYNTIKSVKGNDIVQFINPFLFVNNFIQYSYFYNKIIYNQLLNNNPGKAFLTLCGNDSLLYEYGIQMLKYNPLEREEKENKKRDKKRHPLFEQWNVELAEKINYSIPTTYEYFIGYETFNKQKNGHIPISKPIPMPIEIAAYEYKPNHVTGKIKILHGISRIMFKGSDIILSTLEKIKEKYSDKVEVIIVEKLSFNEYMKVLSEVNILIDQCNSYAYGINALIGLAMGKVVLSGAEQEHLDYMGITDCPVINIQPYQNQIYTQIENIILNPENIETIGLQSFEYVQKYHDAPIVAQQYLDLWNEK